MVRGLPEPLRHLESCDDCTDEMERFAPTDSRTQSTAGIEGAAVNDGQSFEMRCWRARSRKRNRPGNVDVTGNRRLRCARGWADSSCHLPPQPTPLLRTNLSVWVEESQSLEQALRGLRPETRVLTGRQASAIAVLEDRLSVIDAQLGEARVLRLPRGDVMILLRQRVGLMDALVDVHTVKSTLIGF